MQVQTPHCWQPQPPLRGPNHRLHEHAWHGLQHVWLDDAGMCWNYLFDVNLFENYFYYQI